MGFNTFLPDEPCLLRDTHEDPIFLVLWVDDIIESSPNNAKQRSTDLHRGLSQHFPHGVTISQDSATVFHLLGCVVERPSPDFIRLHQRPFLEQLLRRAGFEEGRTKMDDVPVAPGTRFTKADCIERVQGDREHRWFRSVTMSLNHAQNWTRPDLTYLVTKTAKFMQSPGGTHIKILKRGLRYLRGALNLGLTFDFRQPPRRKGLYGFFDASHADDLDTRRSTIAYAFFFSGCALSWKSKLHSFVTTSTNHSELVAAAMAAREAKFLWKLFGSLGINGAGFPRDSDAVDLFSDSMGVVSLSRNPVLSAATKHVEIADFFVREMVTRGIGHCGVRIHVRHGCGRPYKTPGKNQILSFHLNHPRSGRSSLFIWRS